MAHFNLGCLGDYDFDNIALYARKRFVEGFNTIELLQQADSTKEKEEIAFVAMLDLDDSIVSGMEFNCQHAASCEITNCRELIKQLVEDDLVARC